MKARCKNCEHGSKDNNGNLWCTQYLKFMNRDACCIRFSRKRFLSAFDTFLLFIAAIGFMVSILGIIGVI